MTVQEQYASTVRQAQESAQQMWAGVIDSFTAAPQKTFGQPVGLLDPVVAIDQVFDFWQKALGVQRDVVKKLVGVTVSVGETVREQAQSVSEIVREQAEATKQAVHEQAIGQYDELTKAELQDELGRRDLPKTGNVDELRTRLVEDDQK